MIPAYILICDGLDSDELAVYVVLPSFNHAMHSLDFHGWNSNAPAIAAFIRSAQDRGRLAGLHVILTSGLLDRVIDIFVTGDFSPVLVLRRDLAGVPEAALQVCDREGVGVLDVMCARVWPGPLEDFEMKMRKVAAGIKEAADRNRIRCACSVDLLVYLPQQAEVIEACQQAGALSTTAGSLRAGF